MITTAISKLTEGISLTFEEVTVATQEIMTGQATAAQIAGYLTALRIKGESANEIAGMATVMRQHAQKVDYQGDLLDLVGTGGDSVGPFNISTASCFVMAASGIKIAKHGNRAMSGLMGSADLLETLGIKIDLSPEGVQGCIEQVGLGFMFAPAFHPATKHAAPVRRELGIRTVFNILGPLTNPASAAYQLIGVPNPETAEKIASVLAILGTKKSWVVCGNDGMDEITTTDETFAWEITGKKVRPFSLTQEDAGLKRSTIADIKPANLNESISMFHESLSSIDSPRKDIVLLSSGAGFTIMGITPDIRAGVSMAREIIDSGEPVSKINELIEFSKTVN